jgi:uncharacterized damage-inducible protein DinB
MENEQILEEYANGINNLIELISELDEDEIEFCPNREDGWTIKKHLLHIVNVEMQGTIRIIASNTETKKAGLIMDSKSWLNEALVNAVRTRTIIDILNSIKQLNVELMKDEENIEKKYADCTYNGEKVTLTLKENISALINHLEYHKKFISENLLEYKEKLS